jgi:hypothetical protein
VDSQPDINMRRDHVDVHVDAVVNVHPSVYVACSTDPSRLTVTRRPSTAANRNTLTIRRIQPKHVDCLVRPTATR